MFNVFTCAEQAKKQTPDWLKDNRYSKSGRTSPTQIREALNKTDLAERSKSAPD